MNSDIAKIARWAKENGYQVIDDARGYTRFYDQDGNYVVKYPATPSKSERRAQRRKEQA